MKRKEFLKKVLVTTVIAAPATTIISACGDDDGGDSPAPNANPNPNTGGSSKNCIENGSNARIEFNHGHVFEVPKEDIEAGVEKTYSIEGTATHDHTVTISVENFARLSSNKTVVIDSSNDNQHAHGITITCS